ncbi:guanitoxin biosynthesis heme-dependent pre-guanitoxin N-hydroxylase GntA [Luteibacter yeojuensis]|uniref:YqcI/YcgG family protein n=1 Tax=Luteibacter yeojuensis TaxID=345309 RepID=A0A0F3KUI4_9GAMM|nr:guanitoxin biosynthesis heme-dependent pre-guanitoxin N-hydroxylase GntA [Luteibacter yeojuensis]KJV34826.1 hypothetical protein VI08_09625 [Luteibacter yeojuensis]
MTTAQDNAALNEFNALLESDAFPCFAGRTANRRHQVDHLFAHAMGCPSHDGILAKGIAAFAQANPPEGTFRSLVVHFTDADPVPEPLFEKLLFARLEGIQRIDARKHAWDPKVSSDPDDPAFSMSIGGEAFYVVGLHPGASRPGRRLAHPALVFNLHSQFEFLRQHERYDRLKAAIIQEDIERNGSANPMLAAHGESSEAIQYSGRHITGEWRCPFAPIHSPERERA